MAKRLSIIGSGHVGTALGILFARKGYEITDVLNRSMASAEKACVVIGAGTPVADIQQLRPADICIVATSDNALYDIGETLAASRIIQKNTVVFHCSGATPSGVLSVLRKHGAHIASVHPIKSFTSLQRDAESFAGTWCSIEGDAEATSVLEPIFQSFGANIFKIDSEKKVLYHTGIVFICNYLFPIIEAGLRCYETSDVPREVAIKAVEPILHATIDNIVRLGPGKAITGPIARGDDRVVQKQLDALGTFDPNLRELYRQLGKMAVTLSVEKGVASADQIESLKNFLRIKEFNQTAK